MIPEGPLLWYVNRGTGLVLVALLTLVVALGVWSARTRAGGRVPGFAVQALHRRASLLTLVLLLVHAGSAVLDEYVDIRWWQVVVPRDLHYRAPWLAAGIVATDVLVAVALTSLVRRRLPLRAWRGLHLTAYAAWAVAVVHGLGIGTDTGTAWARWAYAGSLGVVALVLVLRVVSTGVSRTASTRPATTGTSAADLVGDVR